MAFVFVYAGTRQPLPAGTLVYGLELGADQLPKAGPFIGEVGAGGAAGSLQPLGYPRSPEQASERQASFEPSAAGKYQVIAIPAPQNFGSPAEAYHALRRCPPLAFADGRMPAVMVAGLRPDQTEPPHKGGMAVRFRAIAKGGDELVSSALSLRDAGPGPRLALARFSEAQARCGQLLTMKVFARALEGTSVRFDVEAGDGKEWKPAGSTDGKVEGGQAVAQWLVPASLLPAAKSAAESEKPGTKLRFHAIAEFENMVSAPLPLLPVAFLAPPPPKPPPPPTPPAAKLAPPPPPPAKAAPPPAKEAPPKSGPAQGGGKPPPSSGARKKLT